MFLSAYTEKVRLFFHYQIMIFSEGGGGQGFNSSVAFHNISLLKVCLDERAQNTDNVAIFRGRCGTILSFNYIDEHRISKTKDLSKYAIC